MTVQCVLEIGDVEKRQIRFNSVFGALPILDYWGAIALY